MSSSKVALVTGITGQDGSYLAEFLLSKGYEVHGLVRRSSCSSSGRIKHLLDDSKKAKVKLHSGDLTDSASMIKVLLKIKPTEIYNLGAQTDLRFSFDAPEYTIDVDATGTMRLLEAIKICDLEKKVRLFQASTSEMYGKVKQSPANESTPFQPRSPYGAAKLCAHWAVTNYRESYGLFACIGILFNHESPRRGESFVTRKITKSVAKIHLGLMDHMELGNIDAFRDWGHSKDYVEAYWKMLQHKEPQDYIIATGECHSVRQLVETSFKQIGVEIVWEGEGINEIGKERKTGIVRVKINPEFYRPGGVVEIFTGDTTKAKTVLGWQPKNSFEDLVKDMVQSDIELLSKDPKN